MGAAALGSRHSRGRLDDCQERGINGDVVVVLICQLDVPAVDPLSDEVGHRLTNDCIGDVQDPLTEQNRFEYDFGALDAIGGTYLSGQKHNVAILWQVVRKAVLGTRKVEDGRYGELLVLGGIQVLHIRHFDGALGLAEHVLDEVDRHRLRRRHVQADVDGHEAMDTRVLGKGRHLLVHFSLAAVLGGELLRYHAPSQLRGPLNLHLFFFHHVYDHQLAANF